MKNLQILEDEKGYQRWKNTLTTKRCLEDVIRTKYIDGEIYSMMTMAELKEDWN